jgi:hypothetical protein
MIMNKRQRIKGDGPDRTLLKSFYKLGELSDNTIDELKYIVSNNHTNDIGGDRYSISNTIDYAKTHGIKESGYRQILLQGKQDGKNYETAVEKQVFTENEFLYERWLTDQYNLTSTISDIASYFKAVYRFRISETYPNYEIPWHIDTNTSVACRAQICITDDDSIFEFKTRTGIHNLSMKPGELWFINTGWNHRVLAKAKLRQVAIFTFNFKDLINYNDILL